MLSDSQSEKQQRKQATVLMLFSLLVSYCAWWIVGAFLNFLDEDYFRMEVGGETLGPSRILNDVARACVVPLAVSGIFIGLPILILSFQRKGKQKSWRYWFLLFLTCLWLSNFGSIVAIVPYLQRYKILPASH